MKVLIVSFYYAPEIGAAPSRITNMAEALHEKGVHVDVLTCLPNYPKGRIFDGYRHRFSKREDINGVTVFRYWTYATVSKKPFRRLLGMLLFSLNIWLFGLRLKRVRSYDRVIIQTPPLMVGFSAVLLFRCLYRRKTILNISDLWPLSAVELGAVKEGSLYYKILAGMERFIYRHASACQGQSQEILDHVKSFDFCRPVFVYRNLQPSVAEMDDGINADRTCLKLVYAGLLGVAQDILGMIKNVNFKQLGAELHIYGGGNQAEVIDEYIKAHDCGVFFHGYKSKDEITSILSSFHASIVPLVVPIKGAVPSKIFDLLPCGTPILFCGGGEGEQIINTHGFGFVSEPGDFEKLKDNIARLKSLSDEEYLLMRKKCRDAAKNEFSFDRQMELYYGFLESLKTGATVMDEDLVSVIMPSYNCEKYVEASIRSVQAQTYKRWELLFVNDGSTDNTLEIVTALQGSDPRIRIISNPERSGAAVARNRALREARGRWIAFLDSDDQWLPTKLERQIAFMETNGYTFTYTDYEVMDANLQPTGDLITGPKHISRAGLFAYNWLGSPTVMYDAQKVGLIQIGKLYMNTDYAMWLKVIREADCYLLDECLAMYLRGRKGSIREHRYRSFMKWYYILYRKEAHKGVISSLFLTAGNMFFGVLKKLLFEKRK